MPRALTNKERIYLNQLMKRNSQEINLALQKDGTCKGVKNKRGMTTPMSQNERKVRERIIKKVMPMVVDLVSIFNAGLLPSNKHKDKDKSASGLCHQVSMSLSLESMSPDFLKDQDSDKSPVTKEV